MNPLVELHRFGQSFWYDNIRRALLLDGTIKTMIDEDGLRGMTSNPSIFAAAIGGGGDYDEQIRALAAEGLGVEAIYEQLAIADIIMACDLFGAVYRASDGRDGYVSLEVSPHLAHDEDKTVAEARRLFEAVNRPNVMIKVPATAAGVRAMERLIAQGVNVNVTLMFSMQHYEDVASAYLAGLASYSQAGGDLSHVASVASFFVSRVDTAVDKRLAELEEPRATALSGRTAIANSKAVYQRFRALFEGDGFGELKARGARAQRLLWASTSTKNPAYPDTLYVDELIGPDTVNTMPPQTIDAFRDHGLPNPTLERGLNDARQVLNDVRELGIDLDKVTEQLQSDGIKAFSDSYDQLLQTLESKRMALVAAS
ncbi:MAG: transaldolase [Chloroflexota bacterium]|jgi:transaldolase